MYRYLVLSMLSLIMLSSCASTRILEKQHAVGDVHEESIQLGEKTIPLPDGRWAVIACGKDHGFFKMFLIREHEDKKFSYIVIGVDTPSLDRFYGYAENQTLNRTNMLHVKTHANHSGGRQDGWCINHFMAHFDVPRNYPIRRKAAEYLRSNGYTITTEMIGVTHYLRSEVGGRRFLNVFYRYNPESEGFDSVGSAKWSTSAWHRMRIHQDPKKLAYIEKLKHTHTMMHRKIQLGFK